MYNNKQYEGLIKNEIHDRTCLNCTPSRDIGEYSGTTIISCTSSTDSGVHISDNDEIPSLSSSPTFSRLHLLLPSSSVETNTAVISSNTKYNENNKNASQHTCNNTQIKKDKNCKIINNNGELCILNGDNDFYSDDDNDRVNSENNKCIDNNKCKVLVDCGNTGNGTQHLTNQNISESKIAINISQQPILKPLASNDKKPLQHNEVNKLLQRPAFLTSSFVTNCPPSKKHEYNGSPVVSIRSISSAIITSDSDSDLSSDSEGVHEKYVIKKLGTQVTYSPNDPYIPNVNSGHTVLNQRVIANDNEAPLPPLAALAAIGDSIGEAQALGPGPSKSAPLHRPQIGSIALSNSSDVTFGDKHFYEGPVTIQQFLIDGRDKWKETNEKGKPAFSGENVDSSTNNAKDINSSAEKPSKYYEYILKRKKLVIPGILAFMALLIVISILASNSLNDSKNTNNKHNDDDHECEGDGTLCLIGRDSWRAHPQKNNLDKQVLPLHRVIISHTASEPCESVKICAQRIRIIQEFHMNSLGWDDIGYNFLISSDGRVYVGRSWDFVGAHTKGYNYDSVGITFIGTYISVAPTEVQLDACLSLMQEGVRLKKLSPDYRLYGARQLGATESPGEMLYKRIKKWQHWSPDINLS